MLNNAELAAAQWGGEALQAYSKKAIAMLGNDAVEPTTDAQAFKAVTRGGF